MKDERHEGKMMEETAFIATVHLFHIGYSHLAQCRPLTHRVDPRSTHNVKPSVLARCNGEQICMLDLDTFTESAMAFSA